MGGIKTPIEIESDLSWNRLVRQSFQAVPVPESWNAEWKLQIPPVSYSANGFVYLIGVGSDSAPATWRLGCSVRLASGAVPDSTGEFSSAAGLPLRIGDRRPCTLGSYTLLTWPDMNLADPHLIIEFPHWLMDATIEIFWYDGETTGDFFSKLRESLVEVFGDTAYVDNNLGEYINSRVQISLADHVVNENAHNQYLKSDDASQIYLKLSDFDGAIADSNALSIALDPYLLKSQANLTFVPKETFEQERTFTDEAVQEAKDIAAADLAAHLGATNPHGITPQAIGSLEEGFRLHNHDEEYAAIDHSHSAIEPTANLQANSLTLSQPLGLLGGGTGATTPADALVNLGAAAASHTHTGAQISGNIPGNAANITGIAAIANGGTGASTSLQALINLGISTGINLINIGSAKIGWGISDNIWQDYGSLNTIFKDINTSSAGFTKTPTYFTSLYGNSRHFTIVGANAIYEPTATGFRIYLIMPSYPHTHAATTPSTLTPNYAATNNHRIAWVGIQY